MTSTIIHSYYRLRYTNFAMATMETPKTPRLPEELVDSTSFLLKRLGFTAKGRSMSGFDEAGFSPYAYAVLATLIYSEGPYEVFKLNT